MKGDKMKTYVFGDPKAKVCLIQPVDDHDLAGIEKESALRQTIAYARKH